MQINTQIERLFDAINNGFLFNRFNQRLQLLVEEASHLQKASQKPLLEVDKQDRGNQKNGKTKTLEKSKVWKNKDFKWNSYVMCL